MLGCSTANLGSEMKALLGWLSLKDRKENYPGVDISIWLMYCYGKSPSGTLNL